MWGGGYTGFALSRRSVGQSVGRSVSNSCPLYNSFTNGRISFKLEWHIQFTSTRGCAEPMLPMCQVKVKVTVKGQIFNKQYYTLCRVRSITPLLMEAFPSNLNDTFTLTRGCAKPMFFPQHILPLLPLYNAQWWGYESLTAIVLVRFQVQDKTPCCHWVQTKRHRLWFSTKTVWLLLNENARKQHDTHPQIEFDFNEKHIH